MLRAQFAVGSPPDPSRIEENKMSRSLLACAAALSMTLGVAGHAHAQQGVTIQRSTAVNAGNQPTGGARSTSQAMERERRANGDTGSTLKERSFEAGKNAGGGFASETGKNAAPAQAGLAAERTKNGSEGQKNAGGFSVGAESSNNGQSAGASNRESEKNGSRNDNAGGGGGSDNRGSDSNREQDRNGAARDDAGNNQGSDNRSNEESEKNGTDSSEQQNAQDNATSQPAPDGTTGSEGRRADKAVAAIEGRRDHATPSERAKGTAATRNSLTALPSRTPGRSVLLDHTAGDGSGNIDPNQASGKSAVTPQQPAAYRPDPRAFSKGQLTGKGLGQPDSAAAQAHR